MKTRTLLGLIGVCGAICLCLGGFSPVSAEDEEAKGKVGLTDLPEPVRKTVMEYGKGAEPAQIEKETGHGHAFYEAEYEAEGAELGIKLDEQGRIVEEERELPTSELPSAARDSLKAEYPDAEIEEVELVTRTYYEVELEADGKEATLLILENGLVLDSAPAQEAEDADKEGDKEEVEEGESKVAWEDLPEAVQAAFKAHRDGAKPEEFESEREGDNVFYEAEYEEENGVTHEIKVDASGMTIEVEDEMDASSLPDAIKAAIASLHPKAEIEEAALKRSTYYVVEIEIGEKESEIKILGNGSILGTEEED